MKKTAATIEHSIKPILADVLISLQPMAPNSTRSRAIKAGIMQKVAASKQVMMAYRAATPATVHNTFSANANWIHVTAHIDVQPLFDNGQTSSHLVRFAAGGVSPGHRHDYDEAAMVMQGWCMVGDIRLNAGDYHMVPAGAAHGDIVSPEGCVLFLHGPSHRSKKQNSATATRA